MFDLAGRRAIRTITGKEDADPAEFADCHCEKHCKMVEIIRKELNLPLDKKETLLLRYHVEPVKPGEYILPKDHLTCNLADNKGRIGKALYDWKNKPLKLKW